MNFDLTGDQQEIQRTARDLLATRATPDRVREHAEAGTDDDALWGELVELGWPGIAIGEEHGGSGLGLVELAVLATELGRAVAPVPFLSTAMAGVVLQAAGSDAQRARWLPGLASGEQTGTVALAGQLVPDAQRAAVLVLVAPDGSGATVLAREDADVAPVAAIDPTRRYAQVAGDGEPLGGDVAAGIDRALVAVAAELVGVCDSALEMTVAYVKDRRQFGVPVGAFQATSHRCAQMLLDTERARAATLFSAWAADAAPERLGEAAAMAKAMASDAGRDVTASAIQAHGGIGFTWEADVHWRLKRAHLDAALLGGASVHRARLARLLAQEAAPVA
jgi:alkylation response protein AidB-like acyl-CoA dehydrogenase